MKKLITIILFFCSCNLFAQTNLEKAVLVELNSYRKTNNLPAATMSLQVGKAAKYHTSWMVKSGVCSHFENVDVPGFTEIEGPEERGKHFGILNDIISYSEICNFAKSNDPSSPIVERPLSDTELAKEIIRRFSTSPGHNDAMIQQINSGSVLQVGIGVMVHNGTAYTTIYFVEK
jgi:uncharacterized protein YkwD